jgi:hypothetical protein
MKALSISLIALGLNLSCAAAAETPAEKTDAQILDLLRAHPEKRDRVLALLTAGSPADPRKRPLSAGAQSPVTAIPADAGQTLAAAKARKKKPFDCEPEGWCFTLRKNWKDIEYLSAPSPRKQAQGAEVSYTNDRAGQNRIWAIDGTVAISRIWHTLDAPNYHPYRQALGAYFTMNRVANSDTAQSSANVNKIAYGLAAEFGYASVKDGPLPLPASYVRFRGGGVENYLKSTSSSNLVLEWMPIVNLLGVWTYAPTRIGNLPLDFRFDPSLIAQHNAVAGKGQSLDFNDQNKAFQLGGQFAFTLFPHLSPGDSEEDPFNRWSANFGYRWTRETYTNRNLTLLSTGFTYNLDPNGYLGLGFSYDRGNDVDTGTFTNLYKVSLTGKI